MLVVARFVGPHDSGVYALLLASAVVLTGFADFGIPSSLVQTREIDEKTSTDTAVVLGIGLYLIYGMATIGTGVFLVHMGQDYRLIGISVILAITNLLAELYAIQLARLNRRMRFGAESLQNIIFAASQAATGIVLAIYGWGVYALAIQALAGQAIANIAILRQSPLTVPTSFSWTVAKRYIALGAKVSAAAYLGNLFASVVSIVFKTLGGNHLLGCWEKATRVQSLLSQNLLAALDRVFFTSFCAAKDDAHRRALVVQGTGIYMVVACGMAAWFYVSAEDLVRVMLGREWADAVPMMRVLAIAVPAGGIYGVGYAASYAMGRTGVLLLVQMMMLAIFSPMFLLRGKDAESITAIYAGSRYFVGLFLIIWVMVLLRNAIARAAVSPLVSLVQGVVCALTAHYLAGPIGRLAGWGASWLPDQLFGKPIPLDAILRLIVVSVVVFLLYIILTIVLQPAMGRRLLQLTARNRTQPVAADDVETPHAR